MPKTYLEIEDIEVLENAATNLRDKLLIRLLFHLGCRITEALSLTVDDIDFPKRTARIVHLKSRLKLNCHHCGTRIGKSHVYCPECGQSVKEAVTKQQEHRRLRTLPVDKGTLDM
jgi:integrase/recombinase XerD